MNPDQRRRPFRQIPHLQYNRLLDLAIRIAFVSLDAEMPETAGEIGLGDLTHNVTGMSCRGQPSV